MMANPLDWDNAPNLIKKHFPHWKDYAVTTSPPAQATAGILQLRY